MNSNQPNPTMPTAKHPIYFRPQLEAMFLPVEQMLQIDRVNSIDGERLVCEMDVSSHWVFPLHFPSDPIFPGTLLIEAAGQAVAIWGWHAGLRGRPRLGKVEAKFESPVLPEDRFVTFMATVRLRKNICLGSVGLFVGERKVAEVTAVIIIAKF